MSSEEKKNVIGKFDCHGDPSTLGTRWTRWLKSFELFADAQGLIISVDSDTNKHRRRAQLLHYAGPDVQDIFYTLADTGENKDYKKAVDALNAYFKPKVNTAYARHAFKQLQQQEKETVLQFVTRLRRAAKDCGYGGDTDNHIRDEVLQKCKSQYLRRRLLEEEKELTLKRTLEIAEQCEKVETQLEALSLSKPAEIKPKSEHVNKVDGKRGHKQTKNNSCYRCGNTGHYGRDPTCPAKGKTCRECGGKDHFGSQCRTKKKTSYDSKPRTTQSRRPSRSRANAVNTGTKEDVYAFSVRDSQLQKIKVTIGGCQLDVMVDSGATTNIVDQQTWEWLKRQKIECQSTKSNRKLYTYASDKPLEVIGTFDTKIVAGSNSTEAEFCVIREKGESLLGRETAMKLGVLKIGIDIATVDAKSGNIGESLQRKYPEVFKGVGKLKDREVQLHIDPSVRPVAQPLRRTPFNLRAKVEGKVKELIDMDIIEPVEGPTPWVNPVVVVPKSNNDIRLCVDMRRANEAIQRERHPIPTVEEITQDLSGSKIFSKLDLKWGYHQIVLTQDSRGITTFATHCGLYRYKRLLFGVCSASEQYQHEIQTALAGIEGQQNISDDIIVHGRNQEEHNARLEKVVKRLGECGLTLNAAKCQFSMDELTFVGMVLSERGISCAEDKVKAVLEAREPSTASEVRSFLGLVNYCGRFIPNLATVSEPLRRLTKQGTPFEFGMEQNSSFEELKRRLTSAETLGYFDKEAPTTVIADASPVGLGAILTQQQKEGPRIISYASRSLSDTEKRYSQTEKEALALVWACEKFHPYVYGISFELVTDHKPLEVIYGPKSRPCARIERWVLRMQPYDFKVKYKPGAKNIADPLSRLLSKSESDSKHVAEAEEYVRFVAISATPKAMTTREVEEASADDQELSEVRKCINGTPWEQLKHKQYVPVSSELCVIGQLVLRGPRIVAPVKLRPRLLSLAHEGHLGITGTKQRLRSKVWWPGMEKDVERYCKACHGCQLVSRPDHPEPIRSTTLPSGPWRNLAVDLLGPMPSGESILVVVDYYSRYYEIDILKSTVTSKIITCLEEVFSRHGLPESLTSDNGPQFIAAEFAEYIEREGIRHHKNTAKWPQANGEVERQNNSLLKRLQIADAEKKDWKRELRTYLTAYRGIPHPTTGMSPAELLFGRKVRTKLPELRDVHVEQEVRDRDAEQKAKYKAYADARRGAKYSDTDIGDEVLVRQEKRNKLTTTFSPVPYKVVDKQGNSLLVESPEGVQYSRNSSHVKKYITEGSTTSEVEDSNTPEAKEVIPERSESPASQDTEPREVYNDQQHTNQAPTGPPTGPPCGARPQRTRKFPTRLNDYVVTKT